MTQQAYTGALDLSALPPEGGTLSPHARIGDYKIEDRGFETPCWIWQKWKLRGYGRLTFNGKSRPAHRTYYKAAGGVIPDGYDLHHRCEQPACVNPLHMEPGVKALHVREHKREIVALSDEQRAEIRRLGLDPHLTQQDIADRFGIPRPTVNKILNGYSWFDGERVLPKRECRGCGAEFQVTNRRQRYCTRECQKARRR